MLNKIALFAFAIVCMASAAVHANPTCEIYKKDVNGTGQSILIVDLASSDDLGTVKFVYFKPNGEIVQMTYADVQKITDFTDLNLAKFLTLKLEDSDLFTIGFGDVNVSRPDVRRLNNTAAGSRNLLVDYFSGGYAVYCSL